MSTTIVPPQPNGTRPTPTAVPDDCVWTLTVEQYHAMAREGILTDEDAVELVEGLLLPKMTKHPPHTLATGLTQDALQEVLHKGWFVRIQDPVTTVDSEPEPDLTVVRGRRRDYGGRHPGPTDVALIVEVADDSLRRDRSRKKRAYARASIAIYWIVNLIDRRIEVYTDPTGPGDKPDYRRHEDFGTGASVPVVIDGKEIGSLNVADVLP
jgi:Uma2 family endonuclease